MLGSTSRGRIAVVDAQNVFVADAVKRYAAVDAVDVFHRPVRTSVGSESQVVAVRIELGGCLAFGCLIQIYILNAENHVAFGRCGFENQTQALSCRPPVVFIDVAVDHIFGSRPSVFVDVDRRAGQKCGFLHRLAGFGRKILQIQTYVFLAFIGETEFDLLIGKVGKQRDGSHVLWHRRGVDGKGVGIFDICNGFYGDILHHICVGSFGVECQSHARTLQSERVVDGVVVVRFRTLVGVQVIVVARRCDDGRHSHGHRGRNGKP